MLSSLGRGPDDDAVGMRQSNAAWRRRAQSACGPGSDVRSCSVRLSFRGGFDERVPQVFGDGSLDLDVVGRDRVDLMDENAGLEVERAGAMGPAERRGSAGREGQPLASTFRPSAPERRTRAERSETSTTAACCSAKTSRSAAAQSLTRSIGIRSIHSSGPSQRARRPFRLVVLFGRTGSDNPRLRSTALRKSAPPPLRQSAPRPVSSMRLTGPRKGGIGASGETAVGMGEVRHGRGLHPGRGRPAP